MESLADDVVDTHGGCNILVNNAGVTSAGAFEDESLDDLHWIVDINLWGVVHGCRAFLPALRRADEAHIVNMSSMVGLLGLPHNASYSLTKGAVRGFTEALRSELITTSIGVTAVFPGAIRTDITNHARGAKPAASPRWATAGSRRSPCVHRAPSPDGSSRPSNTTGHDASSAPTPGPSTRSSGSSRADRASSAGMTVAASTPVHWKDRPHEPVPRLRRRLWRGGLGSDRAARWRPSCAWTSSPRAATSDRQDDDLAAVRELGVEVWRYGMPWRLTEPEPGRYDWTLWDRALDACARHGLVPVIDLCHFGLPDHYDGFCDGTWSVLVHMFPDADVPVVQLSINALSRWTTTWTSAASGPAA